MNADRPDAMPAGERQPLPSRAITLSPPDSEYPHDVLATLPIQIAVLDRKGTIVFVNQAWEVFGLETQEPKLFCGLGANYFDACRSATGSDAALAQEVVRGLTAVAAGELPEFCIDYPCHAPTCQYWFLLQATPLPSADGRIVVSHTNITARKRVESDLQENRARLAAALASMTDAVCISGRDGRFIEFNAAFASFHRFDDKTQCAAYLSDHRDFLEVCFENDDLAPRDQWAVSRALRGETATNVIYKLRRKDTGASWLGSYSYAPIRNSEGDILGSVVIGRDVTEAVQREQALRAREARWQAVLNTAMDAIVITDDDGTITSVDPATEQMFGYTASELIGRRASLLLPRARRREFLLRLGAFSQTHLLGYRHELTAQRKDGVTFPAEIVVNAIVGDGYAAVIRDDTERVEARKRLLEIASNEQRQIGQELHDGIAQDLSAVTLFASAVIKALDKPAPEVQAADRQWLRNTATRIYDGLEGVHRQVQRLARGIMPVQIDAEGLQGALATLVEQTNAPRLVRCQFVCPSSVSVANNATATHLYRIAQEALGNALRHAAPRNVIVSLIRDRNYVVLEVSDDGLGIDAALTVRGAKCAGVGLQTMRYRARAIGGSLTVARQEQGGTLVRCELLQEPSLEKLQRDRRDAL
jgi:PAS domain S-box-containing protein